MVDQREAVEDGAAVGVATGVAAPGLITRGIKDSIAVMGAWLLNGEKHLSFLLHGISVWPYPDVIVTDGDCIDCPLQCRMDSQHPV